IVLNEEISVIGYITNQPEKLQLVTRGGNTHAITAQGWNSFAK
ncbi:MAG: thiamine-phosphate kinase, partial [Sphingobacteriales bacterium]